jgi:hypothetical protein
LVVVCVVSVLCGASCEVVVVVLCDCGAAIAGSCVVVVAVWLCWAIADTESAIAKAAPVKKVPIFLIAIVFSFSQRNENSSFHFES